jgi:hypothetical protein
MLRNKPKLGYKGLTIVLSNPSRFDKLNLLSANGGTLMDECCQPDFNLMQCDVRVMEDKSPLLPNTKCIMTLGEAAMHDWCPESRDNTLNELRGSPLKYQNIPIIASFFPQDAADIVNHESEHNELSKEYNHNDEASGDSEDEEEGDVKRYSSTKRSNYYFWLKRDVWKAKKILFNPSILQRSIRPVYYIQPSSQEIIHLLTTTKNSFFYYDMETDIEEANMLCFAFSFDGINVYCVPTLNTNYSPAYSNLYLIIRSLAICIRDNIIVSHNGSGFDFLVLAYKYKIAIRKAYDTMLAFNRCFPAIEKSLGHGISYFTYERFHKDTDSQAYFTREHMNQKLRYCGMDVFTMALLHKEITAYSQTIPGLPESIKCANDSIVPYLFETLKGIRFEENDRQEAIAYNDRLMNQYIRISKLLLGDECLENIRSSMNKTKTSFLGSDKQQCKYFHELLDYTVMWRSEKTGEPSLGKKIMYRLALKFPDNPVIPLILAYRKVKKETGALKFIPWKDDKGNIFKPIKEKLELYT